MDGLPLGYRSGDIPTSTDLFSLNRFPVGATASSTATPTSRSSCALAALALIVLALAAMLLVVSLL